MKYLIIANWKQHKTISEAINWLKEFNHLIDQRSSLSQVVICPPFPLLRPMQQALGDAKNSRLHLGAQDISPFEKGPYTGEVGPLQLKDLVNYVIIGHSERRQHFGETDEQVAQKVKLCIKHALTPIVCVSGLDQVKVLSRLQRSSNFGQARVTRGALQAPLIIAYEPLTAISTGPVGKLDTPEHATQMALAIKASLGQNTKVIYGGSVDEENIKRFLRQKELNGALVGQASLDVKKFIKIINAIPTNQ